MICVCRCKLVGHDFGAALAWSLAISLPERVERLVVISVGHLSELSASAAATVASKASCCWMLMQLELPP